MELDEFFNYFESALWFVVAATLWARSRRAEPPQKKLANLTSAAFAVFAVSDLIEAQTGAWWTPWWLFVLKATCVAVFAAAWWKYRRLLRGKTPPDGER